MNAIDELFGKRRNDQVRFKPVKEDPGFKRHANPSKKKENRALKNQRSSKKIAMSVASNTSEVVVKVTGYTKSGIGATGKGAGPVSAHIRYIARHGEVALETDKGELIAGLPAVRDFCADWQHSINTAKPDNAPANTRDVMHVVLSMPGYEDEEKMRNAIRNFSARVFGGKHEYAFAIHTDTDNTHGHLVVKCRGFDGKQMQMGHGVAQEWRETFAAELRAQGIDAEATPRSYRGVLQKPERQGFWHMKNPKDGRAPRVPEVQKKQAREAFDDLKNFAKGQGFPENPHADKAKERLQQIKGLWLQAAQDLENSPEAQDKALAEKIRGFVANMPAPKTQREQLRERLVAEGQRLRPREQGRTDPQEERERERSGAPGARKERDRDDHER